MLTGPVAEDTVFDVLSQGVCNLFQILWRVELDVLVDDLAVRFDYAALSKPDLDVLPWRLLLVSRITQAEVSALGLLTRYRHRCGPFIIF